ncbi:copper amine oxidase [Ampelomyces quisqualis]|uniref:primary-amine oxidase n=1 Tax=Ampelomyces quisqualis TaxID=50730 RepID=A0A6A5QLF7_AMPQU|nr:copper amine oxidase [Ampelomyces quisqualis]
MALDRLKQASSHLTGQVVPPHPFDPLSELEIEQAVALVKKEHRDVHFNAVTLWEPRKAEVLSWVKDPEHTPRPTRVADVVCIGRGSKVFESLVDLNASKISSWEQKDGVQPLITMEDLQIVESIVRKDPNVIEQCGMIGIPPEDMHKVYCDPWTIGFDERFGNKVRLQQALMYYRPHVDDSQYSYPLDFCPIYNSDTQEVVHIDVPLVRRPLNKAPPNNYHAAAIETEGGFRNDLKPINITQPEGVSFKMDGRYITWANWKFHIGFNYREGVVLSNITFNDKDKGTERDTFWRLSLAEMVVPYGNPEHPHQRKHAFDLGEYGGGYMTNSLSLGCDCKGAIHYMDAAFVNRAGAATTIKNAICIHEEDAGILFKHTDFRDDSVTVTRARKLLISHVFTAANYEYCVYWVFHLDGTIQLEIKLTGILNTYPMNPGENLHGWGTEVYPGVNAHNHQHLFCMRIDPNIDGPNNTVYMVDAVRGDGELGSAENKYGNAFYAKKIKLSTPEQAATDYNGGTSRTWEMCNENNINPYSKKPVSYKLVSREVPDLLPRPGGLVWKRAGFARHAVHVTKYDDDQLHPAGRHVPQTSGEPSQGIPAWIEANPTANLVNTDVVLWHTFGITHFPSPEDFPVMPAEPMTLLLRPRNFFTRNPCLDVPPSYCSVPSGIKQGSTLVDNLSRLAFGEKKEDSATFCSGDKFGAVDSIGPSRSAMPRAFPPVEHQDGKETPRRNVPKSTLSASVVESVAGFSAGVVSCLAAHPLDLLKNRLQLNTQTRSRPGDSFRILRHVVQEEGGVKALYRGLWPNLLGNSLGWGLYFLFYGNLKELFQSRRQKGEHLGSAEFFSASIIAGLLTGACTNPIWVVKTRMLERGANHPSAYKTMSFGLRHVFETRGLKGLWAGFVPSSLGVLHGAVQFSIYENMKKRRGSQVGGQDHLSNWEYVYMSGGSKLLAGAITYPYQPIRARMQQYNAAQQYNGLRDVLSKTYKNEGLLAFYKGVIPNTLRVIPTTIVTFVVYENTKLYLPKVFNDDEHLAHDED